MSKYARDLAPEEKAKSYSKYFYRPPAVSDPALLAAISSPVDPAKALPLSRINDLLNPGPLAMEEGWCQMPDGTGVVANRIVMPGVTVDMFDWWFAWFTLEDLRYKLWYPSALFSISISEKDRVRVLNDALPMRQRRPRGPILGIEYAGGPSDVKVGVSLMDPEMFGFDMGRFHSPNVAAAVCANCAIKMLEPPPGAPPFKSPTCWVYLVREIPGGIELRTRTWLGWHVVDKIPYRLIPPSVKIPEFALEGLAVHNVKMFSNLASFLPQLYEEQKGVVA